MGLATRGIRTLRGYGVGAHRAERCEPLDGQLGASALGAAPDFWKVGRRAEVVCHGHAQVEVEHGVPPPRWHEDDLARVLHRVERLRRRPPRLLGAWPHVPEPRRPVPRHPFRPHHLRSRCSMSLSCSAGLHGAAKASMAVRTSFGASGGNSAHRFRPWTTAFHA